MFLISELKTVFPLPKYVLGALASLSAFVWWIAIDVSWSYWFSSSFKNIWTFKYFAPFCSIDCKEISKRDFPEEYYTMKDCVCIECGGSFLAKNRSKKYCSNKCQNKAYNKKPEKIPSDFLIFERDNFRCVYCGKSSIEDGVKLEIEHIYPIRREGSAELYNLVTACSVCNGQKSTQMLSDDNILRLWQEVWVRNEKAGLEHYTGLKEKFEKNLESRKQRLADLT